MEYTEGSEWEEVLLNDSIIELPKDLYQNKDIFHEIFNISTWNNLPEDMKLDLQSLLPGFPEEDLEQKAKTIEMLFGGENLFFGNPVESFRKALVNGDFSPENVEMKRLILRAKKRNYHQWIQNYQLETAQKCLNSRKKLLEAATGNLVTVPKIDQNKSGGNLFEIASNRYKDELARIKQELGDDDISSDEDDNVTETKYGENGDDVSKVEDIEDSVEMETVDKPQEMQSCFFSLLRDLFHQCGDRELTLASVVSGVTDWCHSPIAPLNTWYNMSTDWASCVASALAFLSSATLPHGHTTLVSRDNDQFSWIGGELVSDSDLVELSDWWMERCDQYQLTNESPVSGQLTNESAAPGHVTPSTEQERLSYQEQEARRYEVPGDPWQWQCHGYTSVVPPVRNIVPGARPKPHVMLVPDRPAAVSVVSLVRDAVSRLPHGEGTRSDIVELLRDSQYLHDNIETSALTATVSGALDRLQNDAEAPVKYDNNRKIWIYLHKDKTLQDFYNTNQDSDVKHQRQRQKRKFKLDSIPDMYPATSVDTSLSSSASQPTSSSPVSPSKTVQKIIVKGADGKVIPLSTATLQKLIEAGTIKPGTQIATPEFKPDLSPGVIRIVQQPTNTTVSSSVSDFSTQSKVSRTETYITNNIYNVD